MHHLVLIIPVKFEVLPPFEVCEGQGSITSCVTVLNSIERNVEVAISIVDGTTDGESDFVAEKATLYFSPESGTSQCVTVEIVDDTVLENSEFFTFEFSTSDERVVLPPSVDITIHDDERKYK